MSAYEEFLAKKAILDPDTGIEKVPPLPKVLFPFQADIVRWALRRGRAAIFAGTGLGKSLMELSWGNAVAKYTGKPVLLLSPLAVASQMVREGKKFGVSATHCMTQADVNGPVAVTNYQKLDHFDLTKFGGIILDESSILKHEQGHYRTRLIKECANIPFRLAATATPAPNDFMELGNHAEFLGVMSYTDMLSMFFTHDGGDTAKWVIKGHAEDAFWKWMAAWSVMLRQPADLGYDNGAYALPDLIQHQHTVSVDHAPSMNTGLLFALEAQTMQERIGARRDSVNDRVQMAVDLTPKDRPFAWWCNLNSESQMLAKALKDCGGVELSGADSEESKERKILDFLDGSIRVLISKPSICGFGMNFQHCADTGFVGLNDSFEQVYQAIRRFWRFGQTKPVNVHFIAAETEGAVVSNIRRKEADADKMADAMVRHMADLSAAKIRGMTRDRADYSPSIPMELPPWLKKRTA